MLPYVQYGNSEQGLPKKCPPPRLKILFATVPPRPSEAGKSFRDLAIKYGKKWSFFSIPANFQPPKAAMDKNSPSLLPLRDHQPFYPPRKAQNALLLVVAVSLEGVRAVLKTRWCVTFASLMRRLWFANCVFCLLSITPDALLDLGFCSSWLSALFFVRFFAA